VITLRGVCKSFGGQVLYENASLQINARDRFALVGPNGAGKSTLFKMLLGAEAPDSGEIELRRGVRVGYLPQENAPASERSVLDEALSDVEAPDARAAAGAKAALMGLGFKVPDFERPVSSLSGGWAMRAAIARNLMMEPDLLLLDEPTNHLDIDSLLWLQDELASYPGAIFMISHDRAFIDSICSAIVAVRERSLRVTRGDYAAFLAEREAEKQRILSAWRSQQVEIAQMEDFIARNRARHSTAGRAQSMIKRLDRLERIEMPEEAKEVKIRFPQPARCALKALSLREVDKAYGETRVYSGLNFELERGWKAALVGRNGAGKSTLLKLLGGVVEPDSGERVLGSNAKVGYLSQHRLGHLDPEKTVLQEAQESGRGLGELAVRTVLGTFLFPGDCAFKKVCVLSGGEKSRLALVKLLLDPPNVLLLDEPTTHLDIPSVQALIGALKAFEGTICTISHDLHFVNSLADRIVLVEDGRISTYPGNFEYFQRQRRRIAAEAAPREEAPKPKTPPPPRPDRSREREAARIERELHEASRRLEELAARLSDPALYADYSKVQAIGEEMQELQERMAGLEGRKAGLTG
jgi:ATP-binding cassette subfamily F protein 3